MSNSKDKDTFLTVDNMKVCMGVFELFMIEKYNFHVDRDGKNTNIKKLLFDVMGDVNTKYRQVNTVTLKDMNNITLNIARDYFKANYPLSDYRRKSRAAASTSEKTNTRSLDRDHAIFGQRPIVTQDNKPEMTVRNSLDVSEQFTRIENARKMETEVHQPVVEELKPVQEDPPYEPDEFFKRVNELQSSREFPDMMTTRLQQDAANIRLDHDPKDFYKNTLNNDDQEHVQEQQGLEDMPLSLTNIRSDFLAPQVNQLILIDKYLAINGFDRDWIADPNRFSFRVDFNYGENSVQQRYRNIKSIMATRVIVPMEIAEDTTITNIPKPYYNYDFRFSFPYLSLNIDEFDDVYDGTNDNVRRSFCQLVVDKTYKAPNGRGYLLLSPIQREKKVFHPTPLSSINKLTVSLRRPNGDLFNNSKDEYNMFKVEYEQYNRQFLKIVTNKYFDRNEFFKGDTILIKGYGINSTQPDILDQDDSQDPPMDEMAIRLLNEFINRPSGHEILEMGQANDSGYYRNFYINAPGSFDTVLGQFVVDSPLITNLNLYNDKIDFSTWTATNGVILNTSLQCSFTFKLEAVVTDPSIVDTSYKIPSVSVSDNHVIRAI